VWKRPEARESRFFGTRTMVADLSALNTRLMKRMIASIRRQADASGWPLVPVVLENHTKDIGDFGPIEEFAAYVAAQRDLEVITLSEVHENLQSGLYRPVTRGRLAVAS
jgi:hypothetical protein